MARRPAERIRRTAVALSGAAGAGLGVLLGIVWLLGQGGDTVTAVAVGTLAFVLGLAVVAQLVVARAVARLYDAMGGRTTEQGDLERRLAALEEELGASRTTG